MTVYTKLFIPSGNLNHVIRHAQWSIDNSFTPWDLTTGAYQNFCLEDIDYSELSQKYRVVIEGETDRLRLFWLIDVIGETKLNRSIDKYIAKYPSCFPFVSYLLKIYNKKVPPSVYAPSLISQSVVYLLVLAEHSQLKIGVSNTYWVKRAFSFVKPPMTVVEMLDVDKSCALLVSNQVFARQLESDLLKATLEYRPNKYLFNSGYSECRDISALPILLEIINRHQSDKPLKSLRQATQELMGLL